MFLEFSCLVTKSNLLILHLDLSRMFSFSNENKSTNILISCLDVSRIFLFSNENISTNIIP